MFIDSHAHLDTADFDPDRSEAIARARTAQVGRILAIGSGTGPGSLDCAVALAKQYDNIDASIGIHPHEAKLATKDDFEFLKSLAPDPKVVAWGEIGLDFYYGHSAREIQLEVFAFQLEMAGEAELPVIIHTRDAEMETLEVLRRQSEKKPLHGVMHCYSGSLEMARKCLELGFFISFSGMITFPKAQKIRDVAQQMPLDRLLIETDSPYLAPVPHRGKRNEPSFLVETASVLARLKGISVEELARHTAENYYQLFPRAVLGESEGRIPSPNRREVRDAS
jgi:TatD DNase family protein